MPKFRWAALLLPLFALSQTAMAQGLRVPFNEEFVGDDPTVGFDFFPGLDLGTPSEFSFIGYVENRNVGTGEDNGVRFQLSWTPQGPDVPLAPWQGQQFFLPQTPPGQTPTRIPLELRQPIGITAAEIRFTVEGLGCCDDFVVVGEVAVTPIPEGGVGIAMMVCIGAIGMRRRG
jgi:hypothetical protein